MNFYSRDKANGVITPVNAEHVFGGSEAYLIEFCQFIPKQLSHIVNKEQQGSCIY